MLTENIFLISHRRSGTHWSIDTVRNNFPSVSNSFFTLERILPWHKERLSIDEFRSMLEKADGIPIIKSHLTSSLEPFSHYPELSGFVQELLSKSKIIYVYRDGRDVLVSMYHYTKKFNQEMEQVSFSDFIKMSVGGRGDKEKGIENNRIEYWKRHVEGWINRPDVHSLKYEELHSDYENSVTSIGDYIGLEPQLKIKRVGLPKYGSNPNLVGKIINKITTKLVPMLRGKGYGISSAVAPRKGVVGDWAQHFSNDDLHLYDLVASDLMERLGYYTHNSRNDENI